MAVDQKKIEEELQRTKEDLAELEAYINELFSFLPLAICVVNPLGVIIDINKAFEKLTGFSPLEVIGKTLDFLFLEKEEIKKIFEEIEKIETISGKELTLFNKNKEKIVVNVSFSARKDSEGIFIGSFVGMSDITELKKLQNELEKKVEERTKELQEKVIELENVKKELERRIVELERFQKITVGRELKMIELKKEIKRLKEELERLKS
jgi:PAS domain S-box-containing protein